MCLNVACPVPPVQACNSCGKCCLAYADGGLVASQHDLQWWQAARPDIAAYVSDGQIWMDPDSGDRLTRCPWLQVIATADTASPKYQCGIYADRPEDCRQYPVTVAEMERDGCEMLQVQDLRPDTPAKRRQAQQRVDQLMSDSRPGVGG